MNECKNRIRTPADFDPMLVFVSFRISLVTHTCWQLVRKASIASLRKSSTFPIKRWVICFFFKEMSLYYFGSTIKHSCQRIHGELLDKEFSKFFFYNLWRLHVNRSCRTQSKRDQVLCAAKDQTPSHFKHLLRVIFPSGSKKSFLKEPKIP